MKFARIKKILFSFLILALFGLNSFVFALDVPDLRGRVNDYADMLSPAAEQALDTRLRALEESDSTQIVVLTIPSLQGDSLESFSIRVAEQWKIGQKKLDNGAILLVSLQDRKARIEVGYGLEGRLTDLISGRIIDDIIRPYFRAGQYDQGVLEAVNAMASVVRGEYKAKESPLASPGRAPSQGSKYVYPLLFLIILIGMVGSIRRVVGGVAGAVLFPIVGFFFLPFGLWLLLLIPIGFLAGLILPTMLFLFGMSGGRHYGGFGGGGFSGGGFSGGGGGFGGGGASGGW